jgi:cell division protein FtsI (penicillin-binding protein 3)
MTLSDAMPNATFSTSRAAGVLAVLGILLVALVGRVAYLQTAGAGGAAARAADRQQHQTETLAARRGCVYDRNGVLLAGTAESGTVWADPKFVFDHFQSGGRSLVEMDAAVDQLARVLHRDSADLSQRLSDKADARYLKLAEGVDGPTADAVRGLGIPGIDVTPTPSRYYPMGTLFAHVLGGVGKSGHGLEGLELKFDRELAGVDGHERVLKDARRRPVGVADEDYFPARNGRHLVLTVDANIQAMAEQELADTCTHYSAKRGEVVVMDPRTGDVLALANWPTYDPADLERTPPALRRDRALTDPYEPGSTIKPFIVGPSLGWHVTWPDDIFKTGGLHYTTPYGRHITDVHGYDQLCLWDVLVKSSNIGMSMLGERLGNPRLYRALSGWQFGHRTGIELPAENPGRLNPLARWSHFSTESVSQGYEIMVTPIQLARAFCGYANGGRLVTPHLVRGVVDGDGDGVTPQGRPALSQLPQVITPDTAAEVKRILADVPIRGTAAGTGTRSLVWNIFGKTGTAHISEGKAGYSQTKFNSSFLAGAPAEHPQLVIAFIVHEPDRSLAHYGGWVAAPGASRVLQRALAYLQVPPSPDLPLPPDDVASVLAAYTPREYSRDPKDQPKIAE